MILNADARQIPLADGSVHCVVTSPPYFGLRDYGTARWVGGTPDCPHRIPATGGTQNKGNNNREGAPFKDTCGLCGAERLDQLGLEATPEAYVAALVAVFREVWRVLRTDGTCWLNLGDSYATGKIGRDDQDEESLRRRFAEYGTGRPKAGRAGNNGQRRPAPDGLKPKDMVGIPWLVAKALQAPYYTGRMPDVGDRRWMAAMIDGEGTICGFHHVRVDDGRPRTGVHVYVTNGSTALLDETHRIWPTSRSEHSRPGAGHLGTIQTYRWIVHGTANKTLFLREIYPHLIAKKRQAVVAYNLLLLMADAKRLGHTPQRDQVRERRKSLTDTLSALNHGRPTDLPSWLAEPPPCYEPGWYLRSDVIWSKPNPMPESATDRPTKAHEYVFLLAKSERYYYDAEAIKDPATYAGKVVTLGDKSLSRGQAAGAWVDPSGNGTAESVTVAPMRNRRTVWTVATEPYPEAHFATFPQALVEPCVLAGTSEYGCCARCGAPWERIVERSGGTIGTSWHDHTADLAVGQRVTDRRAADGTYKVATTGWEPTCDCEPAPTTRPLVFDPFAGSGTVGLVCSRLGRHFVGTELKPDYCRMAYARTAQLGLI